MSNIYDTYAASNSSVYNQLTSNKIRNVEVYYDTIVTHLSSNILIDRIAIDYDTGLIFSSAEQKASNNLDGSFVISTSGSIFSTGNTLLLPEDNTLVIATLEGSNPPYPKIYEHILGSDVIRLVYNGFNDYASLTSQMPFNITSVPSFDLSYDKDSEIFTVSYIGYNTTNLTHAFATMFVNLKRKGGKMSLDSFNIIRPYTV